MKTIKNDSAQQVYVDAIEQHRKWQRLNDIVSSLEQTQQKNILNSKMHLTVKIPRHTRIILLI